MTNKARHKTDPVGTTINIYTFPGHRVTNHVTPPKRPGSNGQGTTLLGASPYEISSYRREMRR